MEPNATRAFRRRSSDELAEKYSAIADDDSQAKEKREVAILMVSAEQCLNDQGDVDGAQDQATKAYDAYVKSGDLSAQADAMRLIIHAQRLRADLATYGGGSGAENKAAEIVDAAEKKVRETLKRFKDAGNKRGVGAMTLSLAELMDDKRKFEDPDELRHLHQTVSEARALFKEVGDKKMEGLALLLLTSTLYRRHQRDEAFLETEAALACFRAAGDKKGESKALHLLSYAYMVRNELEDAIRYAQEALALFREEGMRFFEAFELSVMAEYYLSQRRGRDALPLAEDALELFGEIGFAKGWSAHCYEAMVQAHIYRGEERKALTTAKEAVEQFQEQNDRRSVAVAWRSVVSSHMVAGEMDEALKAAEEACSATQDIGDARGEAFAHLDIALVHLSAGSLDLAVDQANEALEIFVSSKDRMGEAIALNRLNEVNLARYDDAAVVQISTEQRAIFQELEDKSRAASVQLTIAGIDSMEGRHDDAMALAEESLEWFQEVKDKEGEGRAYNFMAQFHADNEEYEAAIEKAKEMRECHREFGDLSLEARACAVLAEYHMQFDHPADAVRAAREALTLAKRAMDKREIVTYNLLVSTAQLDFIAKEQGAAVGKGIEKALRPAREALTVSKAITRGKNSLMAQSLLQIATVQSMCARSNEAMSSAREALEIFEAVGDKSAQADALIVVAEVHYMVGQQEKALESASRCLELADPRMDVRTVKRAQDLIEKVKGKPRLTYEAIGGVPMAAAAAPVDGGAPAAAGAASALVEAKPKGLDAQEVSRAVQEMAKAAIGLDDEVFLDSPLMDSGMDSLTAVSFRNGLQQNLGIKLPSSLIFDFPSMKEVANRIVELSLEDE